MIPDVLVVGGGPAGRALAVQTARRGLRTLLLDPAPDAPWRHTYGSWAADLPPELPSAVVAARASGRAIASTVHRLGWDYAVLDVPALRAHLDTGLAEAGVSVRAGRVVGPAGPGAVALAGGGEQRARLVVDAGGARQPLGSSFRRASAVPAEQAAYGVIVPAAVATALVEPGTALFMDWRPDHGEPGPPTFLYAVPLGADAVLLEETQLAGRPGLSMPVLRRRLLARLARHGVTPPAAAPDERVLFPLDTPRHRGGGVLGFGAAAPLVHPASGFSLATALEPGATGGAGPGHPAAPRRTRRAGRGRLGGLAGLRAGRAPVPPDRAGGPAADAAATGCPSSSRCSSRSRSGTAGPT